MMDTQTKHVLTMAAREIRSLRDSNKIMAARLEVYDQMMRLFHTAPNYGNSGVMHPDPLFELEKLLKDGDGN